MHSSSTPEPGSIRAAIVGNPGTRLYVHPLEWSSLHLEHLNYHLDPVVEACNVNTSSSAATEYLGTEFTGVLASIEDSRHYSNASNRDTNTRNLFLEMSKLEGELSESSDRLPFQFHGRTVARIPVPTYSCDRQNSKAWACLDGGWCNVQRRKFWKKRGRGYGYSAKAIQRIRSLPIDPLYIGVLIALAQNTRRHGIESTYKVSLFVPNTSAPPIKNKRPLFISHYTADVSEEYLRRFDDPHHFHDSTLRIRQTSYNVLEQPIATCRAIMDICGIQEPRTSQGRKPLGELEVWAYTNGCINKRRICEVEGKEITEASPSKRIHV